jgi:tetratricopeptide (TPR) repeat protein
VRRIATTLVALSLCAPGCAASDPRLIRERVGGALRTRAFASPSAYEAYLRAELAVARGDPRGAVGQMDLAVTADASDGFLAARRAEVLLDAGAVAEALRAAEDATQQHPDAAAAWIALAQVRRAGGDTPAALEALQRAVVIAPDDPDVRAAVSALNGGDVAQVARARRDAPDARDGDRNLARHALLDPRGIGRRWSLTRRRLLAGEHRARGDWAAVDRVLTPTATLPTADFSEREAVLEARARDGRPREGAALLSAVPDLVSVPPARVARAWWLVGEVARAGEIACAEALREDPMALRVCAQTLAAQGDVRGAVTALSRVALDAPWQWAGERADDAWQVPGRELIDAAGRDVSDRHRAWASAQVLSAQWLARGGEGSVADAVLGRSLRTLQGVVDAAASRDALRLARAALRDGDRAGLRDIETVWGRHRRALLRPETERALAVADLAARSGDAYEDANADGWRALRCAPGISGCEPEELRGAITRARTLAPTSPVVLRAEAPVSPAIAPR